MPSSLLEDVSHWAALMHRDASVCLSLETGLEAGAVLQMFKLWCLAEDDLLRESNSYRLVNTGQVGRAAYIAALESQLYVCGKF